MKRVKHAITTMLTLGLLMPHPPAALADEPEEYGAMDLTQLANIRIVTATRHSMPLRKAPAIATIITAEEIRNMGARNLLDVLRMVPGFGVSVDNDGIPELEVRGIRTFYSEKVLVMIDGHSLNRNKNDSAFFNFTDLLPVENIKQVEVLRGPASALYGDSAFVATINVITRDAAEINGLEVKGGAGSFDAYQANLVGGKAFGDKLTISASFDYSRANSPDLTVGADALSGTPFSRAPGTPFLSYHQNDAFLKVGYGDFSFRGGYKETRRGNFIGYGYALTDDTDYDAHESYWGELAYTHAIADGLTANLKLRYDHFETTPNIKLAPNGYSPEPGVVFPNGMIVRPTEQDRNLGGELQVDWDAFKGNHLIGGISFDAMKLYGVTQQSNFDPVTGAPLPSLQEVTPFIKGSTRDILAFYLQDEWQFAERVNLTAGVRYDHYSDFGNTVNPRVGLVWSFLENADLKLLYGQAFRAPGFAELYSINTPVLGNPNLKPETIATFEAGVAYRLNRNLAASLNYFYSDIDDLIDVNTSVAPQTWSNIGKAVTQGVELELNGAFGAGLSWKAFYAYQAPRDDKTGRPLPDVPSHRASGSINYSLTKYVNLHADVLWTGVRPRVQGDTRPEMPPYATVDLAVTARNFWKGLEVQMAVHNLFDKHYSDPDSSGGAKLVPGDFPREGISVFANLLYKF
ncbi:MAG TPA: TonB-dependent receptor [Geobacteraceae bacterium]